MNRITKQQFDSTWGYVPETGYFFWKISVRNGVCVGDEAGTILLSGKRVLRYQRKQYPAASLAYLTMTGIYPEETVSFIDGDPLNMTWNNLCLKSELKETRDIPNKKYNSIKYAVIKPFLVEHFNTMKKLELVRKIRDVYDIRYQTAWGYYAKYEKTRLSENTIRSRNDDFLTRQEIQNHQKDVIATIAKLVACGYKSHIVQQVYLANPRKWK